MRNSALVAVGILISGLVCAARAEKASQEPQGHPKKIVLIAGPLDKSHPKGTHEYEKSVRLLKHCLDTSINVKGIKAEAHFQGWPQDEKVLDSADTIVLISSGADRNEKDHPLLVGNRLETIERQMNRGCGLVLIHWTTFLPNDKAGQKVLDWTGGYFDYQSGPPPRRWLSAIQDVTALLTPSKDHAIGQGVRPFKLKEELYYRIRFRDGDDRLKPVLTAEIPGEPKDQVVAWAVERSSGGRGFGFTGGHYFENWASPDFRKLLLNAIVWSARAEVPPSGVDSEMPGPEQLVEPAADADWTPPPVEGDAAAWQKETDKDWLDARLAAMDTGPFFNASFDYLLHTSTARSFKGTAIRIGGVGEKEKGGVIFDRCQLRLAAAWKGPFLKHSSKRFGLLNTPTPDGTVEFATSQGPGWAGPDGKWDYKERPTAPLPREWAHFRGMHQRGNGVVLSYDVGGTPVSESVSFEEHGGQTAYRRSVEIDAADRLNRMLVCEMDLDGGDARIQGLLAIGERGGTISAVGIVGGTKDVSLEVAKGGRVEVAIAAHKERIRFNVLMWRGPAADLIKFRELIDASRAPGGPESYCPIGPPLWKGFLTVSSTRGKDDAPYVIDTIGVPFDNPWKALMFLSGVDFLPTGELVVCTAHGDVWLVHHVDDKLEPVAWQRIAAGLYQPMGIKVFGDKIYVLERGQLTRLHRDPYGSTFLENVNNDWHTGGGEHSFDTCLEADSLGNFYFFKTGDTELPSGGTLIRVPHDGSRAEVFATGFRHPIGMSVSPTGIVTGADQQGNWMPATRIDQYKKGGFYGDMRAHHRDTAPTTYDGPLCWLPHEVDNSAGGQVWVPDGTFGPLAGQLLHLSWGRCRLMLLMRQEIDGITQGGATDLNLQFLSGVMRGRFNPKDGHLYVAGLDGWQTAATQDGCLQRVRYTGQDVKLPIELKVRNEGIELRFTQELDLAIAEDPNRYRIEQWNYLWSGEYGSARYSVAHPGQPGQDKVAIQSVRMLDPHTVRVEVPGLQPVMQMEINYNLRTAAGEKLSGIVYNTIHKK